MLKIWGKTLKKNKIILSHTVEYDVIFSEDAVMDGINEICVEFDIPRPIVLNKHIKDIREFLIVRFLPDDFIESVSFDKMEVEIFIEKKKGEKR
jgi:hypothetical protein